MTGSGCQQQVVVSHRSELTTTTTADRWRDRDQGEKGTHSKSSMTIWSVVTCTSGRGG